MLQRYLQHLCCTKLTCSRSPTPGRRPHSRTAEDSVKSIAQHPLRRPNYCSEVDYTLFLSIYQRNILSCVKYCFAGHSHTRAGTGASTMCAGAKCRVQLQHTRPKSKSRYSEYTSLSMGVVLTDHLHICSKQPFFHTSSTAHACRGISFIL